MRGGGGAGEAKGNGTRAAPTLASPSASPGAAESAEPPSLIDDVAVEDDDVGVVFATVANGEIPSHYYYLLLLLLLKKKRCCL